MDKNCVQHPDAPAVAACKVCEKSLCLMCTTEVAGDIFCSPKCSDVFSEVKDWIEPKAKPEEWNPLADPSSTVTQLPHDDTALELEQMARPADPPSSPPLPEDESLLDMTRVKAEAASGGTEDWNPEPEAPAAEPGLPQDESLLDMSRVPAPQYSPPPPGPDPEPPAESETACARHPETKAVGACTKCGRPFCGSCAVDTSWGTFCTVECSVGYQAPPASSEGSTKVLPVVLGVAAAVLVVLGILVLVNGNREKSPSDPTAVAKVEPERTTAEPVTSTPKVEPTRPEPPKPEPPKPGPPKPVVKVDPPKPEPPKPEPPKPVVKVEPPKPAPVPPYRALARDPWMGEKPGGWYRIRTTFPAGETYTDVGLKERGADYLVLASQTRVGDQIGPERLDRIELREHSLVRVERLMRRGVTHDFEVLEPKEGQGLWKWVASDGRYAGAALPEDWVAHRIEPERFGDQSIQVKDRTFECLIVESGDRIWLCPSCPLGFVRREGEGTVLEVVDFGDDWSRRPRFPEHRPPVIAKVEPPKPEPPPDPPVVKVEPPKPEPPKPVVKVDPPKPEPPKPEPAKPEPPKPVVKVEPPKPESSKPEPPKPEPKPVVKVDPPKPEPPREDPGVRVRRNFDRAASLIREATPMFRDIADSLESGDSERAQLQALLQKVEEVRHRLQEARKLYAEARPDAPDPTLIEGRIRKLDSLLDTTPDCVDQIKSKL